MNPAVSCMKMQQSQYWMISQQVVTVVACCFYIVLLQYCLFRVWQSLLFKVPTQNECLVLRLSFGFIWFQDAANARMQTTF